MFNNPNTLTFRIEDEYDLHTEVLQYIRLFNPEILMTADLIIQNLHKHYNGLCIEFKTPQCNGIFTDRQK